MRIAVLDFVTLDLVAAVYAAMFVCFITIQLVPWGRLARWATYSALILAFAGGTAWSYVAQQSKSEWSDLTLLAWGSGSSADLSEDAVFEKDCATCPELIAVPAGAGVIGASQGDAEAFSHELPRRAVRIWPGFMMSVATISSESFEAFLRESGRRPGRCAPRVASAENVPSLMASMPAPLFAAGCVTPGDADAYVQWLSERTGQAYRLPTALEWEYAMRTLPAEEVVRGEVSEIVADCFGTAVPKQGEERLAARTDPAQCYARMLKGGGVHEAQTWQRPAARRSIGAREARAEVGFRVVRPLDPNR